MLRCPSCSTPLVAGTCLRCGAARALWRRGEALLGWVSPDGDAARLVWKFFDPLQKEGLRGTVRRAVRLVRPPDRQAIAARLRATLPRGGPRPIVMLPSVDWDVALFQRPQQLARALARLGHPVLYPALAQSVRGGLQQLEERLWLVEDVRACLDATAAPIVLISSTAPAEHSVALLQEAASRGALLVYDFLDEIDDSVQQLSAALRARHPWLVAQAGLVVVTADRLAEEVARRGRARGVLSLPNACDLDHFAPRPGRVTPPELRPLNGKVLLGYYGALASWVDYALIAGVATARPDWHWVLIGVDYDRSLERAGLGRLTNVHLLGPRRYQELPSYLARFDVATVPFVQSDVTDATSPIKLCEYMAAERPIVATPLRECRKYDSVETASGVEAFVAAVDRVLATAGRQERVAGLRRDAAANSWQGRARALIDACVDPLSIGLTSPR
jgi:glycosyltransferase involved in cell wall biosynthesis